MSIEKPPEPRKKGRVVEDERGHQVWQGTIATIKLSLMKTGLFRMSETRRRLMELRSEGAGNDVGEDLELADDDGGIDPYDSAKNK